MSPRESSEHTEVATDRCRSRRPDPGAGGPGPGLPESEQAYPELSPGELAAPAVGHSTARRACSASFTCWTNRQPVCIPPTPSRCCDVLDRLRRAGNSLFVVEHDMGVVRRADWIVDVGPGAGELGGRVLYSGPVPGLASIQSSVTRRHLFRRRGARRPCVANTLSNIAAARHQLPQPARPGRGCAAWGVNSGYRCLRIGKVDAGVQGSGDVVARHLGSASAIPESEEPVSEDADAWNS